MAVTGSPVFSWTGVSGDYTYGVELDDASNNRIWQAHFLRTNSVTYTGPALTDGARYYYNILVKDREGNISVVRESFVYGNAALQNYYCDADGDGHFSSIVSNTCTVNGCIPAECQAAPGDDCDDGDDAIYPGASEVCDSKDNDCNGQIDEGFDVDNDGYSTCAGDCIDNDNSVHPGAAELCDDKDNNCDGQIDEGVNNTYYRDSDADGYGTPYTMVKACTQPLGYVPNETDCNDWISEIHPGAAEVCNKIDDNCNTQVDEGVPLISYYLDADGDGYGNASVSKQACSQPTGYVKYDNDCDEGNANINPSVMEVCSDGIDNDCDGLADGADVYCIPPDVIVTKLPQTGQTKCYDSAGTEIACSGEGQDGDSRAGITWPNPRFISNADTTVTDNLTGLVWAPDGNIMFLRDPGWDSDATLSDGRVTWWHALDYVAKLNNDNYLGYNDWRLPNVNELDSLVNWDRSDTAGWLKTSGLNNVQSDKYWSSTICGGCRHTMWTINMQTGGVYRDNEKFDYYVWPVRSGKCGEAGASAVCLPRTGQTISFATGDDGELRHGAAWPSPRYTVGGECVTDNLTGLMWTKDANLFGAITWDNAIDEAGSITLCGYTDWRLPNIKELRSLIDYTMSEPSLKSGHPFTNVQSDYYMSTSSYWSSTTNAINTSGAWSIEMYYGSMAAGAKTASKYVWPVRSGERCNDTIPFNFADYFPMDLGSSWTYVNADDPSDTYTDTVFECSTFAVEPACKKGTDVNNYLVTYNDGNSVTIYDYIEDGISSGFTPSTFDTFTDGQFFNAFEPTNFILIREWNKLDPVLKSAYGIDPSLTGLVLWVTYDSKYPGNSQNSIVESSLCASLPDYAVTHLEWFQKGVGSIVDLDIDADSGAIGTRYVLTDFSLAPADSISGRVTADDTGMPIPDIEISVWTYDVYHDDDDLFNSTETDSDGYYTISGLAPGRYKVFARACGTDYASELYRDKLFAEEAADVIVVSGGNTPNIDFSLAKGGSIKGRVTDSVTPGDGIKDIKVGTAMYHPVMEEDEDGCSAFTDADGNYIIKGLPEGAYEVSIGSHFSYAEMEYDNVFEDHFTPVYVVKEAETPGINFSLPKAGTISGTVTDADGKPISGITVQCLDFIGRDHCNDDRTGTDGTYTIYGLAPGQYIIFAGDENETVYAPECYDDVSEFNMSLCKPVTVTSSSTTQNIDFKLNVGGSVSGTVKDMHGNPVEGVLIEVNNADTGEWMPDAWTHSGKDGKYSITGLVSGSYRVYAYTGYMGRAGVFHASQYYNLSDTYEGADLVNITAPNDSSGINFTLTAGGTVTGSLTYSGTQRGTVIVEILPTGDISDTRKFSAVAFRPFTPIQYQISGVPAGDWYVMAFIDVNGNMKLNTGEPYGIYGNNPVSVSNAATVNNIDITLASTDTDNDGLPTAWEIANGLDPNDDGTVNPGNGPNGDPDGDGSTNVEEYKAGSNPKNSDSRAVNIDITLLAGLNMFSYPATKTGGLTSFELLALLGTADEIERILIYDKSAGIFRAAYYNGSTPVGENVSLKFGDGILVYAKVDKTISFNPTESPFNSFIECTTLNFNTGMNLAAFPCVPADYSVFKLMTDLGGQPYVSSIAHYNAQTGMFQSAFYVNGQAAGADFDIRAGEAYYIYMKQAVTDFKP